MVDCPVCSKSITGDLHTLSLKCGHKVHSLTCFNEKHGFLKCAACLGIKMENIEAKRKVNLFKEPPCLEGRDYIAYPLPYSTSIISSLLTIPLISNPKKKEPFCWLTEHKSIDWIQNEKQFGLQKMLRSGVTIDDFLSNGYEWPELRKFDDIGNRANDLSRSRQALAALKCNAEHFRDYYHILGDAIKDLQISGKHLVELYGVQFRSDEKEWKSMVVAYGKNNREWKAEELAKLGFKAKDLIGAGIEYKDQYAALSPTNEDEKIMEISNEWVDKLPWWQDVQFEKQKAILEKQIYSQPVVASPSPSPPPIVHEEEPPIVIHRNINQKKRAHGLKNKK